MGKVCYKCKEEKELSEFHKEKQNKDGYKGRCKRCIKEKNIEYRKNNREKLKKYKEEYYKNNKDKSKEYYENNKQILLNKAKEYRENNREKLKKYYKEYKEKNKDKINKHRKNRKKVNHLYKMTCNLRVRTIQSFKANSWKKNGTQKMLGCSFETAHNHLEKQFTKGMSWSNQGKWHIDHIIPLASATTEQELIKLCHYTNLQPLWAIDNIKKGASMPEVQIKLTI